jgi:hypothetical protein
MLDVKKDDVLLEYGSPLIVLRPKIPRLPPPSNTPEPLITSTSLILGALSVENLPIKDDTLSATTWFSADKFTTTSVDTLANCVKDLSAKRVPATTVLACEVKDEISEAAISLLPFI